MVRDEVGTGIDLKKTCGKDREGVDSIKGNLQLVAE
jgi:hypothetical protein